jgi:hypothetical protein
MSNYANEAGEPYMTAAQLNFEAALDEQSAYERQFDYDYADDPEWECETACGEYADDKVNGRWLCQTCINEGVEPDDDDFVMEDQHLDGYWEDRLSTMYEG